MKAKSRDVYPGIGLAVAYNAPLHRGKQERSRTGCQPVPPIFVAVLALAAGAIGLVCPSRTQAQSDIPREETWVTDGPVHAIARTTDTVYIGGDFSYMGPYTGCGVPIDTATGQTLTPFPKVNGSVRTSAPDGAGGWYIGGGFTKVGGVARNCIAHILSDGSVDSAWDANANDQVYTIAVSDSTVFAGGGFTTIGGQTRNYIAALDAATGAATDWNPNANSSVISIAVSGSTVFAGGYFTNIGEETRNYVAALDAATGAATEWNPNASGGDPYTRVQALTVSGSTVYVGGNFTTIGGEMRPYFAQFDFEQVSSGVEGSRWRFY